MLEHYEGFVKRTEYQVISMDYSWSLWECRAEEAVLSQCSRSALTPPNHCNY